MTEKDRKMLGFERCVILQAIAENYLIRTKGKKICNEYPELEEKYGVLADQHIHLLKEFLKEEYKARNLDLDECIVKSGEVVVTTDRLTDYERNVLIREADIVLLTYCTVEDRKKVFLKK